MNATDTIEGNLSREQSKDLHGLYKDSYRLLCGGVVISQSPKRLGSEFGVRTLGYFMEHLRNALNNPETFEFVGAGGRFTSSQYLKYHEKRLGVTITDDLRIVEPGDFYPLAPNGLAIV
jgi:hypothetical protein